MFRGAGPSCPILPPQHVVQEVHGADFRVHVGPLREGAAVRLPEHARYVVRLVAAFGHQRRDAVAELTATPTGRPRDGGGLK